MITEIDVYPSTSTLAQFFLGVDTISKSDFEIMLPTAEEVFLQGWIDALNDNTIPLENLWDGIDAE